MVRQLGRFLPVCGSVGVGIQGEVVRLLLDRLSSSMFVWEVVRECVVALLSHVV